MDKPITDKKNRKSLVDRLKEFSRDNEPIITKGKLRKIKEKLNEPKTLVSEGKDGWGDDEERELYVWKIK